MKKESKDVALQRNLILSFGIASLIIPAGAVHNGSFYTFFYSALSSLLCCKNEKNVDFLLHGGTT